MNNFLKACIVSMILGMLVVIFSYPTAIPIISALCFFPLGLVMCKQDLEEMLIQNKIIFSCVLSLLFLSFFKTSDIRVSGNYFYIAILVILIIVSPKLMGKADCWFNICSFLLFLNIVGSIPSAVSMLLYSMLIACIVHLVYRKLVSAKKGQKCPFIPSLYIADCILLFFYQLLCA